MKKTLLILALFLGFGRSYSEALKAKPTLFIKRGLREQALEMQEVAQKSEEVVKQKMRTILIDLCKKYDACAVIIYKEDFYNILYIDPAYDITKEAFDRLNKEYLESKAR
jgi:hypothetical protein